MYQKIDFSYPDSYRNALPTFFHVNFGIMGKLKRIKFSLVFNRKGQIPKDGRALVQVRAYQNGKERYFSTGVYVEPEHWDDRNKRVLSSHPLSMALNDEVFQFVRSLEEFETRMLNRYRFFPLDRLHEFREEELNRDHSSFSEFFRHKLEKEPMREENRKNYRQTFNKLTAFRKNVYFEELSFTFIRDFDRFLTKKGLGQNTIYKHHTRIKSMVNRAIKEDLMRLDENPYKSFQLRSGEPNRPYLIGEELTRLEKMEFPAGEDHLRRIRDIFLFASYTGLRFSDVSMVCLDQVRHTEKGMILELQAQKTKKALQLPLYMLFPSLEGASRPERILEAYTRDLTRWKDSEEARRYPVFKITNQYFNRGLKIIGQRAGIKVKLSSHAARRTFASIMATKVKVPVIQKLLQHSTPNMTNIYIQLGTQVIEQELKKVEW